MQRHLPWVTIGVGLVLVGLGGWLLAGRQLPGLGMALSRSPEAGRSLSCTIGPFLAIVVTSFRAGSTMAGIALFVAYAVGMGLTVAAAAAAEPGDRRGGGGSAPTGRAWTQPCRCHAKG